MVVRPRPTNSGSAITWYEQVTNVGSAMNRYTGIFTAVPVPGLYYFAATVMKNMDDKDISIHLDKAANGWGWSGMAEGCAKSDYLSIYQQAHLHAALVLNAGDMVRLKLNRPSISSDPVPFSQFIGLLVEQEVS